MWLVGALLLSNLAVLIGLWLRPDVAAVGGPSGPNSVAAAAAPTGQADVATKVAPTQQEVSADSFADRVAAARQNAPLEEEPRIEAAIEEAPVGNVTIAPSTAMTLPTYQEVQARGLVDTAPLHVDIHVYSEIPDDRFVFVNMAKQTEGSRLREGPLVEEIVPEGVILEMNGTRFLLPRD